MTPIKPTIVFLTTYPPRECGIATFTQDLVRYCQKIPESTFNYQVAAFNLSPLDTYTYPREVKWEIDQNSKNDYEKLALNINKDPEISGVIIQHEYGIFGGPFGEKILHFMRVCKKPLLVTLHTALPNPATRMKEITAEIIHLAQNVVVLTNNSKDIIECVYPHSVGKISVIPHGIHPIPLSPQSTFKSKLELSNHTILTTFGLLSRGKGIEYVLQALPMIVAKHPSVLYLILGETHPVIRRHEGERYRLELAKLVKKLGLAKYVRFYDQYLSLSDLLEFLQATDIYISTSIDPNQSVSGTLSYALGAGRAVISTEFAQAKQIITPDVGRLVPIKNTPAYALAALELLANPEQLKEMDRNAYEKTRPMLWSNVAEKYIHLLTRTIVPPRNLNHLSAMTDSVGIFQFAKLSVPDPDYGYTLDDNARALVLCCWLLTQKPNNKIRSLFKIYFAFVKKCYRDDGTFLNYLGANGLPTNQNNKEDLEETQSRALWGLSEMVIGNNLPDETKLEAVTMFLDHFNKGYSFRHVRSQALMIKSLANMYGIVPNVQEQMKKTIMQYADSLIVSLKKNSHKSWIWFEPDLKYHNAILAEGLILAGAVLDNETYLEKGIRSLNFLISKTFTSEMYLPVGQSQWYTNNEKRSEYDQQPEDPASMILALVTAYRATQNEEYKNLSQKCFSWFLGNNMLNTPLYNELTGGCFDGLHAHGANQNQGAESLLSYLMARYQLTSLYQ